MPLPLSAALRPLRPRRCPQRLPPRASRLHHGTGDPSPPSPPPTPPPLRLLFFGTDSFSVPTLRALHAQPASLVSRVSLCCAPTRRLVPAARAFAAQSGIHVHEYPVSPSFVADNFHLGVVASFGHLIPRAVIEAFPKGILNVHGSLLPRWRGATPIAHAIMHGDDVTGVSIMEVKPHKFDVGDVLATAEVAIAEDVFREELSAEMAKVGADLMVKVIKELDHFQDGKWPQPDHGITYAPLLSKSSLLRLPWSSLSALDVWRRHRAVSDLGPFSAGRWMPSQQPVRLSAAVSPKELEGLELDALCAAPAVPGSALVIRRGRKHRLLCVRCRQGWVAFEKIWYANRRPMTPLDFLNGFLSKVQPGDEHEARFQEEDAEDS